MSETKRDLSLFPGNYAFIQDGSKGNVKVCTGPTVITPSAQDKPVVYDEAKRTFVPCTTLEEAVRISAVAVEGFYIELLNPAKGGVHPAEGQTQNSSDLDVGRKINVPGPAMFALWPGQVATVIRGHHLRSNQYLLARVYNEDEAKKNWSSAIMKAASKLTPPSETASQEEKDKYTKDLAEEKKTLSSVARPPPDLTIGKLFIIRGTDVSFFIPPTGITVVQEGLIDNKPAYARDALTLERLEYAVLVDENGKKRFELGPAVVFPQPTERFVQQKEDKEITKKFRAIELNDIQGIHIKVIADYKEGTKEFKAGEELFITGRDTPIYYPREEHAAIKYDGKTKHFATAVPAGEARYVLNRMTGEISLRRGPTMLLPDPRTEIIVRRVLSDRQVSLWYPNNVEALAYNQGLRSILANAPTTRAGALSEGDLERGLSKGSRMKGIPGATAEMKGNLGNQPVISSNFLSYAQSTNQMSEQSQVSKEQGYVGDELVRASTYNTPRTITLEGKYQGVPTVELWTNYAALVVSKSGNEDGEHGGRRVEIGPKTIQLAYDESLEVLELSTGKPKTTDELIKTVFLRVENNKISDKVLVETADHVKVELYFSYVVNFEGDRNRWFAVENYVKFLCDHVRSVLKGAIRKHKIDAFYADPTDIIRDLILGKEKKGMLFEANNMRLMDVEVLGVTIADPAIKQLMDASQTDVVKTNIEVANSRRRLSVLKENETLARDEAQTKAETTKMKNELEQELAVSYLAVNLLKILNTLKEIEEQKKVAAQRIEVELTNAEAELHIEELRSTQTLELKKSEQALVLERLKAEAEATISKFKAVDGNFSSALLSLSQNETLTKVAEAWNIQRAIGGDSVSDALSKVFAGGPLAGLINKLANNGPIIEQKSNNGARVQG